MSEYRSALFTPHTMGMIINRLKTEGRWRGRRHGIKVYFEIDQQPDFEGNRIKYYAYRLGTRPQVCCEGVAATVFDAARIIRKAL